MRRSFVLLIFISLVLNGNFSFAHGWKAPLDASGVKNPISFTEMSQQNGKEIFLDNCSSCHGYDTKGLSKEKTGLRMDTPNLIKRLKNHTEGDFFWKIQTGRGQMPSFKEDLSDTEIWDTINFIRGLSNQ